MTENLYDILGVDPQADTESIRTAYRRLARKYHPDLNPTLVDATRNMMRINLAYEILESPEKRAAYDNATPWSGDDNGHGYRHYGEYSREEQVSYVQRPSGVIRVTRFPVVASTIRSVGYDHPSKILVVQFFRGGTYWYEGVPNKVYQKLMSAPSLEKYFSLNVAYRYTYERV